MTTIRRDGCKVELPDLSLEEFWRILGEDYAGTNGPRWKRLALLSLHEFAGWDTAMLATAFGHPRGYVARSIAQVKDELRAALPELVTWNIGSDTFWDPSVESEEESCVCK